MSLGVATAKKKKVKKSPVANITLPVGQAVPASTSGPPARNGNLASTTTLSKKFKGKLIDDVNAGVVASGGDIAGLAVRLSAPNGNTVCLLGCSGGLFGKTIGALTLDDETPIILSGAPPENFQDPMQLFSPYAGTAEPEGTLSDMDGGPAVGTWTLRAANADPMNAVTITQWSLVVKTRAPYATKTK
jgi:hypothetical protein